MRKRGNLITHGFLTVLVLLLANSRMAFANWKLDAQSAFGGAQFAGKTGHSIWRSRISMTGQTATRSFLFDGKLTFQPEYFDFNSNFSTVRLSGQLGLQIPFRRWLWHMRFGHRRLSYTFERNTYSWNGGDLEIGADFQFSTNTSFSSKLIYWYRDALQFNRQVLNALILRSGLSGKGKFFQWQSGIHLEMFSVKPNKGSARTINQGRRYGFFVQLGKTSPFLINFHYRLLYHQSDVLKRGYVEHLLIFLTGAYLTKKWAIFAFVQWNQNQGEKKSGMENLLYTSMEHYNRLYLKLIRDLSSRSELFIKFGFDRERLLQNSTNWRYLQLLFGLHFNLK